jgi:hypothetical protein
MIDMQGGMELVLGNGARPYQFKISIEPPNSLAINNFLGNSNINTLCKATTIPGCRISQRAFNDMSGHIINLPSNKVYDTEWSATFYLDDFYSIKLMLEQWVALLDSYIGQKPSQIKVGQSLLAMGANKAISLGSSLIGDSLSKLKSSSSSPIAIEYNKLMGDVKADVQQYSSGKATAVPNKSEYFGTVRITQISVTGADIVTYILNNAYPIMIGPIQFDDSRVDIINEFMCSFSFTSYTIESGGDLVDMADKALSIANSATDATVDGVKSLKKYIESIKLG